MKLIISILIATLILLSLLLLAKKTSKPEGKEENDIKMEVIIFPNIEDWYFVIYDDLGSPHIDSHIDINFALKGNNLFWAYGNSLNHGWRETLFYVASSRGGVQSIGETGMAVQVSGSTSRLLGERSYTIRFMYVGEVDPQLDYPARLEQLDWSDFIQKAKGLDGGVLKPTDLPDSAEAVEAM